MSTKDLCHLSRFFDGKTLHTSWTSLLFSACPLKNNLIDVISATYQDQEAIKAFVIQKLSAWRSLEDDRWEP